MNSRFEWSGLVFSCFRVVAVFAYEHCDDDYSLMFPCRPAACGDNVELR